MRGYWSVALKELLHLRRDPATLVIALLIPVVQMTIFGFAIDFDVRHIKTVVVDLDRSRESRAYLQALENTQYIQITRMAAAPEQAERALRQGSERVAVIIPPDFARRVRPGDMPVVRVLIDGSDNQVATRARLAFLGMQTLAAAASQSPTARPDPTAAPVAEARISVVFNPDMRTSTFMIPGLIGVILQLVTVSLTSFSLVREREQGTLEQLMVSPVGRLGLMLGKLTPYAGLAMLEMLAVLVIGRIVFDVRVAGSLPGLLILTVPFIIAALAMGLLISTVAQNQAQALQLTMLTMLPSILMSGFVFPRETMPGVLYLISAAFPVTWFLDILRGLIVRGATVASLWSSALALLIITTALLALSTARFRKSLA